jgi:protein-S-isoprenylcysteine O-methyltransferase Ste14
LNGRWFVALSAGLKPTATKSNTARSSRNGVELAQSLRYFLPTYLIAYFIVAFFWRSYVVWKRTGINPVVFKGSDSAHDFIGRVSKLLFAVIVGVVLVYSFLPSAYQYLMPIPWLGRSWIRLVGIILLIASLLWTILAQAQMGESWRIGIDSAHKTKLIQTGVFRVSRNPIFLGIMVTLLGLFLVIPNAVTLLVLVLGIFLINVQVRLEEEYLKITHGDEYAGYIQQVRRWI